MKVHAVGIDVLIEFVSFPHEVIIGIT